MNVPWRLSWARGLLASRTAVRRLCRPADVKSGLADRSKDTSEGQTGKHLNRTMQHKNREKEITPREEQVNMMHTCLLHAS